MDKHLLLAIGGLLTLAAPAAAQDDFEKRVAGKTAAEVNKNIQVLKTLPAIDLFPAMQFMAASLGVSCDYCHVTDNTGRWPMEKDDKPTKITARRMLLMVQRLNAEEFKRENAVTCATCHRGTQRRTTQPPLFDPAAPPRFVPATALTEKLPAVGEVLEAFVAAIGGREANEKIVSRSYKGTLTPAGGQPLAFDVLEAAPDKLRAMVTTAEGQTVQGVDGDVVWTLDGAGQVHGETGLEAIRMRRAANFYKNLKLAELDPGLVVTGTQTLNGRRTIVLEGTLPSRQVERLFFDAQSGLLVRRLVLSPTPFGSLPEQTDYEDYRSVGQVKLPFVVRRSGAAFSNTQKYDDLKVNVPVDPARFRKPETK